MTDIDREGEAQIDFRNAQKKCPTQNEHGQEKEEKDSAEMIERIVRKEKREKRETETERQGDNVN